ncbi:ATP-dependent nuclease [Clostridium saccharobutylicum]|uniref:ATP-dependent nuclease n=1 Tax=Clostridium saccharobutylicum TaxID=169679 RepID=UPI001625552E|nr:ATP-binding protein [Clostridium saccharobutylicum]MBC2482529.1 ATP-binding protein [Clostridium saccharobutylicum]
MNSIRKTINEYINKIDKMLSNGKFYNYIEYMVFPHYKNLEPNSRIELNFPMTILIGKNGSGKSSTLHAFYGAPKGYSTGEYWFSTNIDPIVETGDSERNRYFYGYKENSKSYIKEVRKARIKRSESNIKKADLDYWETTRPSITDGMIPLSDKNSRNNPVVKDVIYVDFRGEISAFDKYFYFFEPRNGKKQDYLRKHSKFLSKIFDGDDARYGRYPDNKLFDKLIIMEKKHIEIINKILGKNYIEIKMVKHKVYEKWGTSIFVKTGFKSTYSEANSGSGESAIIKLVYKIMNAKPFSLILLDEPEVSLHPSAQLRLKAFLLNEIINKKHQIVISTHSPVLIQEMPKESLKLFETNITGKFSITNGVTTQEAFYNIEDDVSDKKTIICEDISAKILLEKVLTKIRKIQYFNVIYVHGGAETIITKYLPVFATNDDFQKTMYIVLDGDKNYEKRYDIESLSLSVLESATTLEEYFKESTNCVINGYIDGNKGHGREDQKIDVYKQSIKYHYNNVYYLPSKSIPEVIILNSNYVRNTYGNIINKYSNINNINAKEIVKEITNSLHGEINDDNYRSTIKILSNQFAKEENSNCIRIIKIIDTIFES